MESSTKFRDFGKDLIAGGASGIVAKCISAPIERVKLLLQTQSVNSQIKSNSVPYKGGFDCVRRVYLEQGLWSFWRGNVANISRYFPSQAINFAMKDQYKKAFSVDEKLNPNLAYLANFTSGGLAGATALTFIYPLDVARTRLATDIGNNKIRRKFNSTLGCLTEVYKANGVRGLYSGYGAAIGGVVVFRALYLGGYDSAKLKFDLHEKSLFIKYITAQILTTVVGTLCYPLDTIRRKMMMQAESSSGERMYASGLDCVRKVYRYEGGLRGFYPGIGVNLVRGVSGAILLIGYDEIKAVLHV